VLFNIWEKQFDLKTEIVTDKKFFHKTEKVYKFTDAKTKESLGFGVLDLFPRQGKYGHACINNIQNAVTCVDGVINERLVFMVCNFLENKNGPVLLSFNDVITLFHEAGHFLHFLLIKTKYRSSYNISNDFVEIPSQFFENYILNEKFVSENFFHFKTKQKMPPNLLKSISKLGQGDLATSFQVQTVYSIFDQGIHGKSILRYANNFKLIDNYFEKIYKKIINVQPVKNRHFASRFSHIIHGYEAKYYSYVVSKVYSVDFWNEFAKNGVKRNPVIEKYRKLLQAGSSRKELELAKEFLKRKVSFKPFLDSLKK
jgi:Zn-dependent oligopeptidase